jgi:hypothetical protein
MRVRRSLYATSDHVALYTIAVVVAEPQAVTSNQSSQGVAFSGPDLKVGRTNREGHSPRATLYVDDVTVSTDLWYVRPAFIICVGMCIWPGAVTWGDTESGGAPKLFSDAVVRDGAAGEAAAIGLLEAWGAHLMAVSTRGRKRRACGRVAIWPCVGGYED